MLWVFPNLTFPEEKLAYCARLSCTVQNSGVSQFVNDVPHFFTSWTEFGHFLHVRVKEMAIFPLREKNCVK